ncbi:hypothetical protein C8F04DRAFT_1268654 [Mycena alexandri]|uniref:Uncharacterized protein n=1 Tax=Mycena alexandri TaxID=1745969 RepID=A0AAD6SEA8_9AGAR|nr:hypothetical protein C8F04DRAFT_1268654 [Mycena alexandri]
MQAEEEMRRKEAEAAAHQKQVAEDEAQRQRAAEEEARCMQAEEVTHHKQVVEEEARRKREGAGDTKKGKKRQAVAQLVPEEEGTRRTSRKRLTPEEAKLAREQQQAATVATGKKPSYEYVEKSPVKPKSTKKRRYDFPPNI